MLAAEIDGAVENRMNLRSRAPPGLAARRVDGPMNPLSSMSGVLPVSPQHILPEDSWQVMRSS